MNRESEVNPRDMGMRNEKSWYDFFLSLFIDSENAGCSIPYIEAFLKEIFKVLRKSLSDSSFRIGTSPLMSREMVPPSENLLLAKKLF